MSVQSVFWFAGMCASVHAIMNFWTSQPICGSTGTPWRAVVPGGRNGLVEPEKGEQMLEPFCEKHTSGPWFGHMLGQPMAFFGKSVPGVTSGLPAELIETRGAKIERSFVSTFAMMRR